MATTIATDDSMSDDVFEASDEEKSNFVNKHMNGSGRGGAGTKALTVAAKTDVEHTPSPTGYPGYKPPPEALRMYAYDDEYFHPTDNEITKRKDAPSRTSDKKDDSDNGDGWKSYTIEDDSGFDENIIHKV